MNYIREINSFYDWLETNPVSDSARNLWYALMHTASKSGWKEEFAVAISTLELKTSLKKDAIIRARNTLMQSGRISFISRSGQQSALYKIISFEENNFASFKTTQTATQTTTQTATQTTTQTASINKLNKTKLNSIVLLEKEPKEGAINISEIEKLRLENETLLKKLEEQKEKSSAKKEKVFKVPSVSDIKQYCDQRKNGIDAQMFWDFYNSKKWMIGKNKMKDWESAVRTWEGRRKMETETSQSSTFFKNR